MKILLLQLLTCISITSVNAIRIWDLSIQQSSPPQAKKVADFRPDRGEFLKALGEDFARLLREDPHSRGYVIFYCPNLSKGCKIYRRSYEDYAKDYIAVQGIGPERIIALKGGYRHEPSMEYWLVPADASPPKPTPEPLPKERKKKVRKTH